MNNPKPIPQEMLPAQVDYTANAADQYMQDDDEHDRRGRMLPSQQEMRYLEEPDIPLPQNAMYPATDPLYALASRHLEMTAVLSTKDLIRRQRDVRNIVRQSMWSRWGKQMGASYLEQREFMASKILIPKSYERGERRLLTTVSQHRTIEQTGERVPSTPPSGGFMDQVRKRFGFGGR